ncbi:MAG: sodium:proton antiporter [Lachnospiraceae bacterium]
MKKNKTNYTKAAACLVLLFVAGIAFLSRARIGTHITDLGKALPFFSCLPFAGMLLCIAVLPLMKPRWWERHKKFVVLFWSALFLIPFAIDFGFGNAASHLLQVVVGDYLTFIVLLLGLFCVSGNISLEGDLVGSPKVNVLLLLLGTLLSSWIGTTGASMVMIRPIIRANKWRNRKVQIMIFFIFLVSNIGGCLTPVGDPPLLMGFMRNVPFFWSFHLLPIFLFNVIVLLVLFFILDTRAYKKDIASGLKPRKKLEHAPLKIVGGHNIIFLLAIVLAVILSGVLPKTDLFTTASGAVRGIPIFKGITLSFPSIIEIVIILLAAFLSFKTTKSKVREDNNFNWDPIKEVAILFIGIFITMIPALLILESRGAALGLTKPAEMFWATGALSSFLDNTPTYLVFLTTAGALGTSAVGGIATTVGTIAPKMLMAISCGAVFMGANTYIGNAPNFMVCSIAEQNNIKMPSFFGYLGWSLCCLIPLFLLDMILFFL